MNPTPWDKNTTLGELPGLAAARWGDRKALKFKDRWETFSEISRQVDRIARGLIAANIRKGDRVGVWLNNCPEWVHLLFAIARIGAIQVPINTRLRTSDAAYIIKQAEIDTLITHDVNGPINYWEMISEMIPENQRSGTNSSAIINSAAFPFLRKIIIKPAGNQPNLAAGISNYLDLSLAADPALDADLSVRADIARAADPAFIMYTSGTTGFPKGVVRCHGFLRNQIDRVRILGTTEKDIVFNYLPLFHIFGYLDGPMLSMATGNSQILSETFEPDICLDAIENEGVTQISGFEAHVKALTDAQERQPRNLSSLRTGVFGIGSNSALPIYQKALKILAPLRPISAYGMTEIGGNACLSFLTSTDEQILNSSGHPCDGFYFRVIDPDTGQDQPINTPGEIILKTYNMMLGYYKMPEETRKAYNAEGWFLTGDMGYLRADGFLRFLGRYKDMLKIGGENVDPMEVEAYLLSHPDISDTAVIGHADERLTEVAVAFVVPKAGKKPNEAEILNYCKGQIASFKIPRHLIFVSSLPMTSSGKVQKAELRLQAEKTLGSIA